MERRCCDNDRRRHQGEEEEEEEVHSVVRDRLMTVEGHRSR